MTSIAPMLGAIMGISHEPKGQDKKRAAKPHTPKSAMKGSKNRKAHKVTKGEGSATAHGQQHGELASYRAPTQHTLMKESAKGAMRNATDDWVRGRISTGEHLAIHDRAKHVLSGKRPHEYRSKGR
jgi:hypothetical protein